MIEELRVCGVGGIKEARLNFDGDFIVITGESGSGKSSLVRAMEFITGKRAQSNLIHTQADASDVELLVSTERANGLAHEYQPQENTLIARRIFDKNGKGRCMLQGLLVPLNILTQAMEREIVIQSQFAQLGLLDPARQLDLVDSCGGTELKKIRDELAETFHAALTLERNILAIRKERDNTEKRFESAEPVIRQVRAMELDENSQAEWERELRELDGHAKRSGLLRILYERLTGPASGGGVLDELEMICKELRGIDTEKWHEVIEKTLTTAQYLARLLQTEVQSASENEGVEEARERLERKLGVLRKLTRDLKLPPGTSVLEYAREAEERLAWLRTSREELESFETQAAAYRKKIAILAKELRDLRKKSALKLQDEVNRHLDDLAMEQVQFEIRIEELNKVRATGAENAAFMLRVPDQSPLPVGKTASGGELSRILIALQLASGDDRLPGTLVFDEVEAGLGGKTAVLAGEKLKELSRRCRTILITHEAAIAAMADQHFLVKREGEDTLILEIKGPAREKEIARMLAGDEESQEALDHARVLLAKSK